MLKSALKKIDGILLLNKPLHLTSNHALQRVKRLIGAKKAGHTGSLDPLATGMLPICFGEATKFSQFLLDSDKKYEVTMKLGIKTTTGDAEGQVIETKPVEALAPGQLENLLPAFSGKISQIPPMFSAIKYQGKPLYELARKGIEIERKPRQVNIYNLELKQIAHDLISLQVHCSKGTYVRTLVEDIGEQLGCGAHVIQLHRTCVIPYQTTSMQTMDMLEDALKQEGVSALSAFLLPVETSVQSLPSVKLSTAGVFYLRTGQSVMTPDLPKEGFVRIYSDQNKFLGVGEVLEDGRLAPRRLVDQSN